MKRYISFLACGLALTALAVWTGTAGAAPLTVSTAKVTGAAGADVEVPIAVKGIKDAKSISCMSIRLSYDPALLTVKLLEKGTVLPNAIFDKDVDEKAGVVALGFACGSKTPGEKEMASVEQDGVVLKVVFTVNDKAESGKKSSLKLDNYRVLDNGELPSEMEVRVEEGEFVVSGTGLPDLPWLWIALGAIAFLLLLIILLLVGRRKKEEPRPVYGVPPVAAPPAAPLPRFTPEGATTIAHTCSRCGGVIQLPTAMTGQSFQCGACGATQVAGS